MSRTVSTAKNREQVRLYAARAVARARGVSRIGSTEPLVIDIEHMAHAIDVLCDVIAQHEFHQTGVLR